MTDAKDPVGGRHATLPGGISANNLIDAIKLSGYPLQLRVGAKLRSVGLATNDEWTYIDRTTGATRALDVAASKLLVKASSDVFSQLMVRPRVQLLVECKRSEMPYVFFRSRSPADISWSQIAGLNRSRVQMHTPDDDPVDWTVEDVLELSEQGFVYAPPITGMTFAKLTRAGSKLEITGEDPFNSLVLPLISATTHFRKLAKPNSRRRSFDGYLLLAVAVLEAPMFVVDIAKEDLEVEAVPWVRIVRRESSVEGDFPLSEEERHPIDVVHVDYLDQYLKHHALPFARHFARRVIKLHQVLADGAGFLRAFPSAPKAFRRLRPLTAEDHLVIEEREFQRHLDEEEALRE